MDGRVRIWGDILRFTDSEISEWAITHHSGLTKCWMMSSNSPLQLWTSRHPKHRHGETESRSQENPEVSLFSFLDSLFPMLSLSMVQGLTMGKTCMGNNPGAMDYTQFASLRPSIHPYIRISSVRTAVEFEWMVGWEKVNIYFSGLLMRRSWITWIGGCKHEFPRIEAWFSKMVMDGMRMIGRRSTTYGSVIRSSIRSIPIGTYHHPLSFHSFTNKVVCAMYRMWRPQI